MLEARLGAEQAPVDLSLRLKNRSEARGVDGSILPPHLQTFLSAWQEPEGPFAQVRSVWLEFDLNADSENLPFPIPCAKLWGAVDPDWLTGTLLPALHGKPLTPGQRARVRACLAALPAPASLLYAFSLSPRHPEAVRLEIYGLAPAGILDYLSQIAPNTVEIVRRAAGLFEGVERIHLSFDITSEILPRIGIEGSFSRLPEREPRWRELFGRLVAAGLCTPEKRDAALAWSGYDTARTAPWPVGGSRFCVRSLSHVKVVCQPQRQPEAKVYLAFGPLDRPRAE